MFNQKISKLSHKKRYLQIALNNTLAEAQKIISQLPISDRILVEVGTPMIKFYGVGSIKKIKQWYKEHLWEQKATKKDFFANLKETKEILANLFKVNLGTTTINQNWQNNSLTYENVEVIPYIVADLKMMDRGEKEVEMAAKAGADAAIALGHAPIESLNAFIQKCEELKLDAMVDMMNVEYPLSILRKLKKIPRVVILHRGVDEEKFNKEKQIPLHEIRRIKSNYKVLIAIAGGDTIKEVQQAVFNDADIVIIWKHFFQSSYETTQLVKEFLKEIK